jgi:hypothetical protein
MEAVKNLRVERQLFSLLPPIINTPRSPVVYPAQFPNQQVIVHNGILSDKHYMCLDIISDLFTRLFIKEYFNKKLPRRYDVYFINNFSRHKHLKAIQEKFLKSGNCDVVKISISKDLIYAYPWMRGFHFKKIAQLFKELSNLKITANIEVVYFQRVKKSAFDSSNWRIKEKINNYYKKMPIGFNEVNFFDFEYLNKHTFSLLLKNVLGNLLMHNCAMLNHIYVPDEFYSLSKYAQFLYRKVIANEFNKDHEYPQAMVAEWLNLRNKTVTQLKEKIIGVLEELKQFGYIEYEYHPVRGNEWYNIIKKRKNRTDNQLKSV